MAQIIIATFRAIYTCRNRNCKHVWALEYRNEGTDRWGSKYGTRELNTNENAVKEDAYAQGRRSYHVDVMGDLHCPECGCNLPKGGQVQGHYSESHTCGAKCRGAKDPNCDCQCGGENHGVGHLVGHVQKDK